jgi:hypothetical protein
MTSFPLREYSKSDQLKSTRVKLTQRQMGEISPAVDKELKERSGGICERCIAARATERAHLIRRGKLTHKTTANDLAHLCTPCHDFADESGLPGRKWLKQFQSILQLNE